MEKHDIPTAKYKVYNNVDKAIEGLNEFDYPVVIKADGLCFGKGVIICNTKDEGIEALSILWWIRHLVPKGTL